MSGKLYDCCTKRNLCPSIKLKTFKTVNNVDTIKTKRMSIDVLEWSDAWETDEEDENVVIQGNNVRYRKSPDNIEPPPAYHMV